MSLPFLRPSSLPRPSTIRQFLRATNTRTYSTPSTPSTPEPTTSTPSPINASTKPYRVLLSPSNQYPVYQISKRGGNKHETKIKNIQGDVQALRSDLQELLSEEGKEKVDVMLKNSNGQLVVK
ncbi:putative 54S ribosomal protein IMG2, mitochondrial [Glarea lozoyensis 74030]|nr:putative 54S ribosomal protein IMG2, mitochondrial [Glarea lozoyensis 74030]